MATNLNKPESPIAATWRRLGTKSKVATLAATVGCFFAGSEVGLAIENNDNQDSKAKAARYMRELKIVQKTYSTDDPGVIKLSDLNLGQRKDLGIQASLSKLPPGSAKDVSAGIDTDTIDARVVLPSSAQLRTSMQHATEASKDINYFDVAGVALMSGLFLCSIVWPAADVLSSRHQAHLAEKRLFT